MGANAPAHRGPGVVIIGGGISGLATAFYLQKAGISSTIVEQSGRLGGLIQTDCVEGCQLEGGPDSFLAAKTAVAELAKELGMADQLLGSNDAGRRIFVVRGGRLMEMPKGMVMMVPSDWKAALSSSLFSLQTKRRFLQERRFQPLRRVGDFSIEEMMVQHFGREALDYLTEPLLAGVYGGSAARLSAPSVLPRFVEYEAQYGSLIRGVQASQTGNGTANRGKAVLSSLENAEKSSGKNGTVPARELSASLFLSFSGGMQTLTDSLARAVRRGTMTVFEAARAVSPAGRGWRVELADRTLESEHVVMACPAHKGAELLAGGVGMAAGLLAEIPYSSSVLVTVLFRQAHVTHQLNGFGFLVPPPERRTIAAATWINTKFPSRVSPNLVAIRAFLVDPEAERYSNLEDDAAIEAVLTDLRGYMGIKEKPVYAKVHRWPKSMPQYVVGHSARISKLREELKRWPGLHLSANYLDGVGIPDCVRHAKNTADAIARGARGAAR